MIDPRDDEPVLDLDEEASDPEDRERLVRQASALAEVRDAQYRRPSDEGAAGPPWRLAVAVVLFLVGLVFLARPPGFVRPPPPPVPSASDLDRGVRAAVRSQAAQVEAFRVLEGGLPQSLDDLGHRIPDIRYVRSDARVYQLVAVTPGGDPVVFDSSRPQPALDAAAPWILRP